MLISKTATVRWNKRNKKWYESKGYIFTKWKDEFEVKVEDLSNGSSAKVEVQCDGSECTTPIKKLINWLDYLKCVKEDGKYYCKRCAKILYGSNTQRQIKLMNGNSFAQWGINNLGEDFLERYWDYEKNKVSPWEITKSSTKSIYIKCQEKEYHGSYKTSGHKFVYGRRCPYCSNYKLVHPLDSLGALYPQVLEIWSDKNKKSPYEYSPNNSQEVWWKCENDVHKDYYRSVHDSQSCEFRCSECTKERNESILQEKVRIYLGVLGFSVVHEYNCTLKCVNPITNSQLPYDNEIKIHNKNLIIEVHGSQHYHESSQFHKLSAKRFNTTPEQEFKYLQQKDKYKEEYALLNGYKYLIIPYYTDDAKETWKELINTKIIEIEKGRVF